MAWPTTQSGNVLSGDGAQTFGRDLYDRDVEAEEMGWTWYFAEQTTTSTSYTALETFRWYMPPWAVEGATVKVTVTIGNDSAATTSVRLSDGTNNGTAETTTAASESVTLTLTVPAGGYDDTVTELQIQAKGTAGDTASVAGTLPLNMWVEEA